jgi:D-alanyl-D-alanine carboxypeptidase/D-alanyl-D-alanine-endopeptidase (penicillin-binding protein 4)
MPSRSSAATSFIDDPDASRCHVRRERRAPRRRWSARCRTIARFPIALLLVAVLAGCATATAPVPASLAQNIDRIAATPPLDHAIWGILVEEDDGTVLYERNAHRLMIPASNLKLFASLTAANCLGLDARLTTELWLDGGSTPDVIVRGDGDPSFGAWRHESPGFAPFVAALRERGITRVRDVVADVSRFDRQTIPGSWKNDNLTEDYGAPADALAYDENVIGERAVPEPALRAGLVLRDALVAAGIAVDGNVRVNTTPRAWGERLASVESPTVFQLIYSILKNSHNLYAEMLFKRSSPLGTYAEAAALERDLLTNTAGIDPNEFRFVDGSGLSPDDLVAPSAVVRVLRWMNAPERRGIWWMLLATPGEEGTLHYRMTDLGERFRGKTGTLNSVNALSGIVRMPDGRFRYFSAIVNHHTAGSREAQRALDAIAHEVAR